MGLLKEKEVKSDFIARILFDEQQLGSPKIRSYTVLAVWISFYSLFSSQYSLESQDPNLETSAGLCSNKRGNSRGPCLN